ncbi:MAG: hypothetical protein IKS93_01825 [Methanobrevibacter sp.]|nr:hypothetical protein [Methanobrevibacter sp.]
MSESIMSRNEMFDVLCKTSNREYPNTEELQLVERYLDNLLEPIVYEVKRFCDSYYEGKKRNDPDFEYDKTEFNLSIVQFIAQEVLSRINEENK